MRPGFGAAAARAIELALEPRDERGALLRRGPRPAVVRRHHAGAQLAHDVLPRRGVGGDVADVERLERKSAVRSASSWQS